MAIIRTNAPAKFLMAFLRAIVAYHVTVETFAVSLADPSGTKVMSGFNTTLMRWSSFF
jgi:hypothetical protein